MIYLVRILYKFLTTWMLSRFYTPLRDGVAQRNSMRITVTILLAGLLLITGWAGAAEVNGVRVWPAPDHTRVVFDISSPTQYRLFSLTNPDRVVIDIDSTRLARSLDYDAPGDNSTLRKIRSGIRNGNDLRIVLDVSDKVRPETFMLKPNQAYGHRLVVDLHQIAGSTRITAAKQPVPVVKSVPSTSDNLRDIVIAIDAGHGGEDTGALGRHGTREKDVVLGVARELERLVRGERGMRPVMIRDGDYYTSLRKRTEKARRYKADLMISIHADAFKDPRASGATVYVLSERGASSEAARLVAAKENAADLVGGVSLEDKDELLASVLVDLSQTATIEASYAVASEVLGAMRPVAKIHKRQVEQAGFVVLKSPDVPSILVETAFISNPAEERKLRDRRYQRQLAQAIHNGVRAYFRKHPPAGTLLASTRHHIIARGESLSVIAQRYQVSVDSLRFANNLSSDQVQIGQRLLIPSDS